MDSEFPIMMQYTRVQYVTSDLPNGDRRHTKHETESFVDVRHIIAISDLPETQFRAIHTDQYGDNKEPAVFMSSEPVATLYMRMKALIAQAKQGFDASRGG